jgi:aryl-alcohol dehydrogenase-like predicted oxidoreductase
MRKIELVPGISSSVLGLGCAPILGSVDVKNSRRALECALDFGINHFDLARSYGYGEAEEFVGKVIGGRRKEIILTSKFGIKANWKANLLRPIKPFIRLAKNQLIQTKSVGHSLKQNAGKQIVDRLHDRIPICKNEMKKSLEKSLRALGTDYLDYFLIHDPHQSIMQFEELMEASEDLKREGKIRAFGLAYMRSQGYQHLNYLKSFDILQFDASPGAEGYDGLVKERGDSTNIIFSPLQGGSTHLKPSEKLLKLFSDFPETVVLCSMFSEAHLKANVGLVI